MHDQIKSYFERFGEVSSIEIQQKDNETGSHFGLVEFKLTETATTVLASNGAHRIGDCDVQVKAADPWLQPDQILNALDDHCLRMILSNLNLVDLANAANVCIRFKANAESTFLSKFKKLDVIPCSRKEVKTLLPAFGSIAPSIHISLPYDECVVLSMIARYCTSMRELTFGDFWFEFNLFHDMKFGNVEKLSFSWCGLQSKINQLLSSCTKLKSLCIKHCSYDPSSFDWPEFNELQELRLVGFPSAYDRLLNDIISKNPKISKFTLLGLTDHNSISHSRIIRAIVQNLPNLEDVEFNMPTAFVEDDFDVAIRCLADLTHLKVLKINLNEKSAAPLTAAITENESKIEHLQLIRGTFNAEAIGNISQMKQLTVLELCNMSYFTDERMIELVGKLGPHLERLEIRGYTGEDLTTIGLKKMLPFAAKLSNLTLKSTEMTIDADDYKDILKTLQKRAEKLKFSFEFISGGEKVNVPKAIQVDNHHILHIDEKQSDGCFDEFRSGFFEYYA